MTPTGPLTLTRRDETGGVATHGGLVNGERRRRQAATLLLVTSVLWLHQWLPVLLVAAWASWLVLHKRLEGDLGEALVRLWRRAWPPVTLLLAPLLLANTLAYWVYAPVPGKIVPIILNLLGLSIVLSGDWWPLITHPGWLGRAPLPPGRVSDPVATKA